MGVSYFAGVFGFALLFVLLVATPFKTDDCVLEGVRFTSKKMAGPVGNVGCLIAD